MSGKGSTRRPTTLTAEQLAERWAATFDDRPTISASARPDVSAIDERMHAWHVNAEGME